MWRADGSSLSLSDVSDSRTKDDPRCRSLRQRHSLERAADLSFETMTFTVNAGEGEGIRSHHPGEHLWFGRSGPRRVNVGMVDGSVTTLEPGTPPGEVRSLLLRSDGLPAE